MIHFDRSQAPLFRITVTGDVDRDQIRAFYRDFKPALDAADRVGILVDMTGFGDISAGAMLEDMMEELGLLDDLGKMPRAALITGNRFMAGTIRYLNPVIPRMEMRTFLPDEAEDAAAWARDLPEKRRDAPGVRMIDSRLADVLAFEVDGYMDDDDMDDVVKPFRDRIDRGRKFNALARIRRFAGFDPEILVDKAVLGMKWDAIRAMHRYAIVTDQQWVRPFAGMARLVTQVDIRLFPLAEEEAAWAWVGEPVPQAG
ncbi:STAS/SEC14 domain-containing protein [Pseudooceanicola onchidii]|uniref:STAS/SEC14 domain-containing protein n=1 Tax=Pseudooceanicola onchidii TaxID=2562279 RepID=UPI0010A9CE57|nr:STAS/SEC14 domain-containing protein [Pseudooceanicola onchidii]